MVREAHLELRLACLEAPGALECKTIRSLPEGDVCLLPDPAAGLRELRRLLHRDGRAAVLDFNRSTGTTAALQTLALRRVVVPVASQLGLKEQYAYLETSIAEFPTGLEQEQLAMAAGFSWAQHRPMAGGLMGLLELRC